MPWRHHIGGCGGTARSGGSAARTVVRRHLVNLKPFHPAEPAEGRMKDEFGVLGAGAFRRAIDDGKMALCVLDSREGIAFFGAKSLSDALHVSLDCDEFVDGIDKNQNPNSTKPQPWNGRAYEMFPRSIHDV